MNFDRDALMLAVRFAGAGHVLAGSDYPHMIGSIPSMKEAIAGLELTDDEKAAIFGGTAAALLGLGVEAGPLGTLGTSGAAGVVDAVATGRTR